MIHVKCPLIAFNYIGLDSSVRRLLSCWNGFRIIHLTPLAILGLLFVVFVMLSRFLSNRPPLKNGVRILPTRLLITTGITSIVFNVL